MRKYVITGGACSGKTTVINHFKKRGYSVLEETAREVIEERKNFNLDKKEKIKRQEIIFNRQFKAEESYSKKFIDCLFLDRSLIDGVAYFNYLFNCFSKNFIKWKLKNRYDLVFVLDRLPFEKDGLRIEKTEEEAAKSHQKIIKAYRNYGYSLIFVPVMPVEKRVEFILNCVNELEGGDKNERKNIYNN